MQPLQRLIVVAALGFAIHATGLAAPADAGMLAAGAAFPAWELSDHDGKVRTSAELAGKAYLLWFYPKASTPGCTAEGRALRDAYVEIKAAGLAVVGVSFDDPKANAEFARAEEFPFPLLSDGERKLATSVGAADSPDQGYARRISYLVGGDATVLVAYESVDPKSHAAEVLKGFRARNPVTNGKEAGERKEP